MSKFSNSLKLAYNIQKLLNLTGNQGTSCPGKIIQKYNPDFLAECNEFIGNKRAAITGTNGKSTTSGVLYEILSKRNTLISNKLGANMPNGIITAIALGLYEHDSTDGAVLECDEAYFSYITNRFEFNYILVTNLFRDQLDRYGEMDSARNKIIKGIELNPNAKVIINADDSALYPIADKLNYTNNEFVFFGIENVEYSGYEKSSKSPSESPFCSKCGLEIQYKKRYYAQLGDWYCSCGNSRKKPDVRANVTIYPNKSVLEVNYKNQTKTLTTTLTGLYNAYNVLGAIAASLTMEADFKDIENALDTYSPIFGRHQKINLKNGSNITIHLIKNPVGASEVLRGLKNLENSRILIAINDNYADGKDVSWLFDADFEALSNFNGIIYTTGLRSYDMALRLKYAGVEPTLIEIFDKTDKITKSILCAIDELDDKENLVVLATYTALLEIQKNIKKLENA